MSSANSEYLELCHVYNCLLSGIRILGEPIEEYVREAEINIYYVINLGSATQREFASQVDELITAIRNRQQATEKMQAIVEKLEWKYLAEVGAQS